MSSFRGNFIFFAQIHLLMNGGECTCVKIIHSKEISRLIPEKQVRTVACVKICSIQSNPSSMKQQSVSVMIEENDLMQFIRKLFYFYTLMILFIPRHKDAIYTALIPSLIYFAELENRLTCSLTLSCTKQCLAISKHSAYLF